MAWTPKYTITKEILSCLTKIESIKNAFEDTPLSPVLMASLHQSAKISSTHYSTRIEGNRLSLKQVENALHTVNKSARNYQGHDEKEVGAYYDALTCMERHLDTYIKEKIDPTLSFTCSCRSSICGACAVRVNDNAELSCEVLVETLMQRYNTQLLTIKPLGNFRVIRDLIVDWDPKYARLKKIKPTVEPKDEFSVEKGCKQTPAEFDKFKKYAGCILCGSCVSECNKNALNESDFLDPFVFVKAERLVADSRDKNPKEHLQAVQDAGLWRCFNCQECTAKCPKGLDPAGAIEKLKEATHQLQDIQDVYPEVNKAK